MGYFGYRRSFARTTRLLPQELLLKDGLILLRRFARLRSKVVPCDLRLLHYILAGHLEGPLSLSQNRLLLYGSLRSVCILVFIITVDK